MPRAAACPMLVLATLLLVSIGTAPGLTQIVRKVRVVSNDRQSYARPSVRGFIDKAQAQTIADEYREWLLSRGYVHATVEPELAPAGPSHVDLLLHVKAGTRFRIARVEVVGERSLAGMKALKVGAPYWRDAVEADLTRLRSRYIARGYFDASVRVEHADLAGDRAVVQIRVDAGPRYRKEGWSTGLCRCLLEMRRDAERQGILDFAPSLWLKPGTDASAREIVTNVARGPTYRIRRIDFQGHRRYSDSLIRRHMLVDEGDPLDATLLRRSLDRLNRSHLFEPVDESAVDLRNDSAAGIADVRIRLRERKAGSWLLSGPVGPMSIAGPLQFTLASRLPAWGSGLIELSSYSASFNVLAYADPIARLLGGGSRRPFMAFASLDRPWLQSRPWTSGFAVAPQLGARAGAFHYGSTQVRERLLPLVAGSSLAAPALPVKFGDGVLLCEPPPPRWKLVRRSAAVALQVALSLPAL